METKSASKARNATFGLIGLTAAAIVATGSACSSKGSNDLANVPIVAPIVDAAAPSALRASAALTWWEKLRRFDLAALLGISPALATPPAASEVATQLQALFKSTYGRMSGGSATGYINTLLVDLDGRMDELKGRFTSKDPSCFSRAPQAYTVDASFVDSAFKLSIDAQCLDHFGGDGDVSFSGSGMVFGKGSDGSYSLWLGLNHDATSGFAYAAKVSNPGTSDKSVDMLYLEGESMFQRGSVARLKAKPSANTYELVFVSTANNAIGPATVGPTITIGCGIKMISDGTLIYAKGESSSGFCSAATPFEACLNASDLSVNAGAGACDTLKASFTIASATDLDGITSADVPVPNTSSETRLHDAMQIDNAASVTGSTRD